MTQSTYALLSLTFSLAVCGLLYALYSLKREKIFLPWLATWTLLSLHYAFSLSVLYNGSGVAWAIGRWFSVMAGLGLVSAARAHSHAAPASRSWRLILGFIAFLSAVWVTLYVARWRVTGEEGGPLWVGAAASLWAAALFWRRRRTRDSVAVRLLAGVSLMWFLVTVVPASLPLEALDPLIGLIRTLTVFNLLIMAVGMLILASEAVLQRVEDNIVSFSLLNLSAVGQQSGADLERMADKLLDRVLDVYSVPRGLIFLDPGDREPEIHAFRGWPEGFAELWRRQLFARRLSASVARMGGLVSIPHLDDPGALALLDADLSDTGHPALGEILRGAGVRSLIAVSLRTPKRVFGALVLAPRAWSLYTSAELRLLTSFGVQVGMGVENFLLMRGVSRRSEELNLLHQTGRAIGSTLETGALLRRIHEELSKLIDASNFYVAILDPERQEVGFEVEVEGGRYLPRRSRPIANGLTEHIVRTEQTVLIRSSEQMREFQRLHGVGRSGRSASSWCGAPVVIRGRPVGVIAVQSYDRENAYDEGHLEILRIVAAQAAVALENARLFADEQGRLRELTVLHSITQIAISTLNPEDMLQEIAREIEKNFGYDHIGIGLLDYETKLVDWKAEAGPGQGRIAGRKSSFDQGIVGQVIRGGKPMLTEGLEACLPISYADQMLGVLHVRSDRESRAERLAPGLSPATLPILQTIAAHLATALHNAFVFQRTQEQAITDGLTGVKTHRYFVEAINNEWKRATRSGRVFSLLVMDLDHFKQVNDTMGHLEGDMVLVRLARILEERCRKSNIVARYGGDEFMVLMPETNTEQAFKLADRLRLWIATEPMFSERGLTASFGVSTYPVHGHTPEEIIRVADAGMYLAKHQGGNHVAIAEQFRLAQADRTDDRWRAQVFAPLLEGLRKRIEPTGPEAMERLIQRLEDVWEAHSVDTTELQRSIEKGLTELADLMEERVNGASGHQVHVMRYAMLIASGLKLTETAIQQVRLAARLHDVGYLAIPTEILENRERLTQQEFSAVHVHAGAGARLLQAARLAPEICDMVRHHHEFVNGRGYPDGLPGSDIPVGARILAVADAFDAITGDRPYRPRRNTLQALEEMERYSGTQFDELLVKTFAGLMRIESGTPQA